MRVEAKLRPYLEWITRGERIMCFYHTTRPLADAASLHRGAIDDQEPSVKKRN